MITKGVISCQKIVLVVTKSVIEMFDLEINILAALVLRFVCDAHGITDEFDVAHEAIVQTNLTVFRPPFQLDERGSILDVLPCPQVKPEGGRS